MPEQDDPFARPEPTMLRPRPGAGRRGSADTTWPPAAPAVTYGEQIPAEARALLGLGLNPLVRAASPLLLLAGQLRGAISPVNIAGLRSHALEEIRRFEEYARASSVPNDIIIAARYVLCAGMDEAVLSTPWGAESEWAQHPLLVTLHREAWGGEKFFEMLDRISADPSRFLDLMELQYLVLAFGFAGKYAIQERGLDRLAEVQRDLYRRIRSLRGVPDPGLSLRWRGLEDRRNPLIRYVPWWVVGAAALVILVGAFAYYRASLRDTALPIHAALAKVGLEDFTPVEEPVPTPGPTLKQLLAPEETRGTMIVEEQGARTMITLLASDWFASGSATVNPAHHDTLRRMTAAINQVPGRVLVVGHTDDQPLRSLRFQDNFELSRERALSVVRILEETIDNKARISWNGVGSSQPRYRPESEPENRARNRRVEILHVRGS
jgi:type VI secretion system protein ImpK